MVAARSVAIANTTPFVKCRSVPSGLVIGIYFSQCKTGLAISWMWCAHCISGALLGAVYCLAFAWPDSYRLSVAMHSDEIAQWLWGSLYTLIVICTCARLSQGDAVPDRKYISIMWLLSHLTF